MSRISRYKIRSYTIWLFRAELERLTMFSTVDSFDSVLLHIDTTSTSTKNESSSTIILSKMASKFNRTKIESDIF
ncbi:hypothetical protein Glove_167g34 [Diversispora epigaea]|uniref:Uncharacterized protein n=1 Tax=Diversispora epigaea TaxID=1348612 RepID=A0A397IQ34_9GLOM|nr:hypothetical protein Glove_167g34 [Diversispora epigaea]